MEKDGHLRDSHAARLRYILDDTALQTLFRQFLRDNYCEENLSFWLDVQEFKRKFNTTSSADASTSANHSGRTTGLQAMEKHQQDLIKRAFAIYNCQYQYYFDSSTTRLYGSEF